MFEVVFVQPAIAQYAELKHRHEIGSENRKRLFKQVAKTIGLLAQNPRHPSLNTHEYDSLKSPYSEKEKVFEAYAQNNTPGAYRVFWCYGPEPKTLTIIAITSHP